MENIDKDIEKVNKLWYLLDDVYSTGLVEDEERNEYQQAISNVLSELEEKIEQIKVLENNNRVLDISLGRELETHKDTDKELEKYNKAYELETYERQKFIDELETYKKIAEKLASKLNEAYFEQNDFWLFFEKEILKGIEADYGYVGDVIIDWAKREVEK